MAFQYLLNYFTRPRFEHCYPRMALDEVAAALHAVRGQPKPRRIVNSIKLLQQFPGDFAARDWRRLQEELDCLLPPLENGQLPCGWETVFDLAAYVATKRVEFDPPAEFTLAAWRNAQVFAGVRDCMVEQLALEPYEIHRDGSFAYDYGCD